MIVSFINISISFEGFHREEVHGRAIQEACPAGRVLDTVRHRHANTPAASLIISTLNCSLIWSSRGLMLMILTE